VRGLNEFGVAKELPRADFFDGNWENGLNDLLNRTGEWKTIALDGPEIAAQEILNFL